MGSQANVLMLAPASGAAAIKNLTMSQLLMPLVSTEESLDNQKIQ